MVSGNQPEWLPSDWVEVKDKRQGKVLCYRNTETGQTFFTKEDVQRYIKMVNISNSPPQPMDDDNDLDTETKTVIKKSVKVPEWLPRGWTMELRSRDSGPLIKCFVHPEGKRRFYSKPQVFRYLETVNSNPATQEEPNVVNETRENYSPESAASQRDGNPEWLPQGWTMELKYRESGISGGSKYKCYIAPGSGRKFFSKPQVYAYLKTLNSSHAEQEGPNVVNGSGEKSSLGYDASQRDEIPDWLPEGWTMEMRVGVSGANEGRKYKCYIAPGSGHRCYSRPQVYDYLKTQKSSTTGQEKERVDQLSGDKCSSELVVSEECKSIGIKHSITKSKKADDNSPSSEIYKVIERGPVDGLPPGWIKEVRSKKAGGRMRRDPYFIDPLSGYEFRSKPDALRYLETGDIKNCAIKPKRKESKGTELMISKDNEPLSAADTQELEHSPIGKELFPVPASESSKEGQDNINDTEVIKEDISVIERASVDGLPPGWIKEVRSKKIGSRIRKDPYFIDPQSGYEFRSKPDALRYLETGDIKNCALKPKRREPFPGGLAVKESENSEEKANLASENCSNGTVTEKHPKPGDSDSAAKASSAENGSFSTAATDTLASGTVENGGPQSGTRSNKSKNKTATPLSPGRSSKRLKGAEPEIKADPLFNERAIRSTKRGMPKQPEAEPESKTNGEKPANDLAVQEVGPGMEIADKPNGDQQTEGIEPELLFPFGESLGLDPCLEFAVKTLTGAIPVEDKLGEHVL